MRTTITIDDALYQQALEMADPGIPKAEIFWEAMKTYVRVQATKLLAILGTAASAMEDVPSRRPQT